MPRKKAQLPDIEEPEWTVDSMQLVARFFGVHHQTAAEWFVQSSGSAPRSSYGRRWRYNLREIMEWRNAKEGKRVVGAKEAADVDAKRSLTLLREERLVAAKLANEEKRRQVGQWIHVDEMARSVSVFATKLVEHFTHVPGMMVDAILRLGKEATRKDLVEVARKESNRFVGLARDATREAIASAKGEREEERLERRGRRKKEQKK